MSQRPRTTTRWHMPTKIKDLKDQLLDQLDDEARRTRNALEHSPAGRDDWKPHAKSMPYGRLSMLVATMPSWIELIIDRDDLDLNPPGGGSNVDQRPLRTSDELLKALDDSVKKARDAIRKTNEDHL